MENKTKIINAKVLKTAMNKSAVVSVERLVKHPVNGKYIKRSTKYHVHDENNKCVVGDEIKLNNVDQSQKQKLGYWLRIKTYDSNANNFKIS